MTKHAHRYRKRPVIVEAFGPLTPANADEAMGWVRSHHARLDSDGLTIHTPEGNLLPAWDDYIIRGAEGELYSCKPEVFAITYDLADEHTAEIDGATYSVHDVEREGSTTRATLRPIGGPTTVVKTLEHENNGYRVALRKLLVHLTVQDTLRPNDVMNRAALEIARDALKEAPSMAIEVTPVILPTPKFLPGAFAKYKRPDGYRKHVRIILAGISAPTHEDDAYGIEYFVEWMDDNEALHRGFMMESSLEGVDG